MCSALELAGPTGALYESVVSVEAYICELQAGGIACRGLFAFGGRDLLAVAELGAEAPYAIDMYDIAVSSLLASSSPRSWSTPSISAREKVQPLAIRSESSSVLSRPSLIRRGCWLGCFPRP